MTKTIFSEVPDRIYYKLIKKKELDGFSDKEWDEWLKHLVRNIELEPTMNQQIRKGTRGLLPMWMKNFADNIPLIRKGKTLRDLIIEEVTQPPNNKAVVIGRGPSLFRKNHLQMLKESRFDTNGITVAAADGILIDCLKNNIIPDYVVSVDAAPIIMKWFDSPLVDKYAEHIKIILNTQINHDVAERVIKQGFQVYWFEPALDSVKQEVSITKILILMTCSETNPDGVVALECIGNVGATSLVFTWNVLKRSNIALIGFDYGYPDDMPLNDTYYYDKTIEQIGALQASTYYEKIWNPYFGTTSKIDPAFKSYRENLFDALISKPQWLSIRNCTEGGTLFHPSLECMYFKDWLSEKQ